MSPSRPFPRRHFLGGAALSSAWAALGSPLPGQPQSSSDEAVPPSERIGLATIGMGIIGFIDTRTALRLPGVELIAAADCYDGRLTRTKEVFGDDVTTTRDYREILARDDVDAVIVSTPDHWHARIAVDALKAGKHVYCEKPMVQKIEDGHAVIEAARRTGKTLQVGSQYTSSLLYHKARELYRGGAIGRLNMIEARYNRSSAIGAWQYSIAPDASPETIDWQTFLGPAPERPFDPVRFFRWRNYWDYGTGIPGDLFVHLLTGIHFVVGALGPNRVMATGGLRHWKDGRDVPDVILGLYDYPEGETHPPFTLSLQSNFADGGRGGTVLRFVGDEGAFEIDGGVLTLKRPAPYVANELALTAGYNSVFTFSEAMQEKFVEELRAEQGKPEPEMTRDDGEEWRLPDGYDARLDHFARLFEAVRGGEPVVEDATFGLRAAAPALLANVSYRRGKAVGWDARGMKVVTA